MGFIIISILFIAPVLNCLRDFKAGTIKKHKFLRITGSVFLLLFLSIHAVGLIYSDPFQSALGYKKIDDCYAVEYDGTTCGYNCFSETTIDDFSVRGYFIRYIDDNYICALTTRSNMNQNFISSLSNNNIARNLPVFFTGKNYQHPDFFPSVSDKTRMPIMVKLTHYAKIYSKTGDSVGTDTIYYNGIEYTIYPGISKIVPLMDTIVDIVDYVLFAVMSIVNVILLYLYDRKVTKEKYQQVMYGYQPIRYGYRQPPYDDQQSQYGGQPTQVLYQPPQDADRS